MLEIANDHTLIVQSPDGKMRQININDAKLKSAKAAIDTALQDFKQATIKKNTLTCISWEAQLSKYKTMPHPENILEDPENGKFRVFFFNSLPISQLKLPTLITPCLDHYNYYYIIIKFIIIIIKIIPD